MSAPLLEPARRRDSGARAAGSTSIPGARPPPPWSPTCTATTSCPAPPATSAPRPRCPSCASGSAPRSRPRASPTASGSASATSPSPSIPPATCWARPRSGSKPAARSGSCPATTSARPIRPALRSRSCPATSSSREATFALPLYRWHDPQVVVREILAWWDGNRAAGVASVLFAYAMGKAPRILAELAQPDRSRRARCSCTARWRGWSSSTARRACPCCRRPG